MKLKITTKLMKIFLTKNIINIEKLQLLKNALIKNTLKINWIGKINFLIKYFRLKQL